MSRHGVEQVTDRQLHQRVASARWIRMLPGVYRVAAVPRTFRQRAMAASLWSGGHISHSTAARLWGLEGSETRELHVIVGRTRGARHAEVIVHRTDDLAAADTKIVHGIPATSPLRSVLDIAAMVDTLSLELMIEDGLRRRLFPSGQLRRRASERCGPGVPGSRLIRELLQQRLGNTDSGWERRVARLESGRP